MKNIILSINSICWGVFILKLFRLIFVFVVVLALVSCSNNVEDEGLNVGFLYDSSGSEPAQEVFCGFSSSESTYTIGTIILEFYIGIPEYSFGNIDDLSSIIIYAKNLDDESKVNIYTISTFGVSDFAYNKIENDDDTFTIEYTYSVEISIPESMFSSSDGSIELGFEVLTADNNGDESIHFSTWNIVSYVVANQEIELVTYEGGF